jgi:hypothetical protein
MASQQKVHRHLRATPQNSSTARVHKASRAVNLSANNSSHKISSVQEASLNNSLTNLINSLILSAPIGGVLVGTSTPVPDDTIPSYQINDSFSPINVSFTFSPGIITAHFKQMPTIFFPDSQYPDAYPDIPTDGNVFSVGYIFFNNSFIQTDLRSLFAQMNTDIQNSVTNYCTINGGPAWLFGLYNLLVGYGLCILCEFSASQEDLANYQIVYTNTIVANNFKLALATHYSS